MRPAPQAHYEVRGDQLFQNGRVILEEDTYFAGPAIWWQLGSAEEFGCGDEFGQYYAHYDYPSRGLTVMVGEMGISGFVVYPPR